MMTKVLEGEEEELNRQGFSEEQSIEKALDSFGQENNVVNEIFYVRVDSDNLSKLW